MHFLQKKSSRSLYLPWLQQLVAFGDEVEVRGKKTLEILDAVSIVEEPWHHCILIPSRRWNPFLALSEALWILAGRDDIEALAPYNSHIKDYSDDGISLYGAYGKRIYPQIDDLIERLRKDPSDRRAVLQIWDNTGIDGYTYDLSTDSKDPPCNNMVYFKLRQNKLHMTVINRSNDIHFGLFAVNLPTFGILQSYIAARLGVEMGTQTHFSNSLHVYTDEPRAKAITERMLYNESEDMPNYPKHELAFNTDVFTKFYPYKWDHEIVAKACSEVLDNKQNSLDQMLPFLNFAEEFLGQYRAHRWNPDEIIYKDLYFDWVVAGDLFIDKVWKKSHAN